MIVPIIPFRLQDLGYTDVSSLVGWLLFAYVCKQQQSLLFPVCPKKLFF